jgi:hypothetical protein
MNRDKTADRLAVDAVACELILRRTDFCASGQKRGVLKSRLFWVILAGLIVLNAWFDYRHSPSRSNLRYYCSDVSGFVWPEVLEIATP